MFVLILTIIIYFYPDFGINLYLGFFTFITIFLVIANNFPKLKVKNEDNYFTENEVYVMEYYSLFFKYSYLSPILSSLYSRFGLSVYFIIPYLYLQGYRLSLLLFALVYFICKQLSVTLNPRFFLHDNLDNNRISPTNKFYFKAIIEMTSIDSALEKINLRDKERRKNEHK
jgi:hypothetical protein